MKETLRRAFVLTIPVLCGYLVLGIACGVLLQQAGFGAGWAFFTSLFIYAGSMQFVLVNLLSGGASLLHTAMMTLMINFRLLFYGLSLIERFRGMGAAKPYMIHALSDETYSLLCLNDSADKRLMLCIGALNQSYWVIGSVLGALLGAVIPFDTTGIDFAMTALFVVILVEQWKQSRCHLPALIGGGCALACLVLFGADSFLPPAMLACVALLLLSRRAIDAASGNKEV